MARFSEVPLLPKSKIYVNEPVASLEGGCSSTLSPEVLRARVPASKSRSAGTTVGLEGDLGVSTSIINRNDARFTCQDMYTYMNLFCGQIQVQVPGVGPTGASAPLRMVINN